MAGTSTPVLSADEIAEKWLAESEGRPWVPRHKQLHRPPADLSEVPKEEVVSRAPGGVGQRVLANSSPNPFPSPEMALSLVPPDPKVDNKFLRDTLARMLKKYGVEPAEELVKMAVARDASGEFVLTTDQRIRVWEGLMAYQMPKLKAIEMSGTIDHELTVVVRRFDVDTVVDRRKLES